MLSSIVTEATSFEMELRGHKQATAHSHEHTKKFESFKKNFRDDKIRIRICFINSKKKNEIVRIGFGRHGNPLDREIVELPKQASPLTSSCEGDNRHPGAPAVHQWDQAHSLATVFDVGQRSDTCFVPSLLPHRAPAWSVSPSSPGDTGSLGTLRAGGMSSNTRAPWDAGCGPVPLSPAQHHRPIPSWLC